LFGERPREASYARTAMRRSLWQCRKTGVDRMSQNGHEDRSRGQGRMGGVGFRKRSVAVDDWRGALL